MPWREAVSLGRILCRDPSSWLSADMAGLRYAVTPEWFALRALHDRWAATHYKAPPPKLPTPWDAPPPRAIGAGTDLTPEQYHAIIAAHRAGGQGVATE